jgi:hypothetical protein
MDKFIHDANLKLFRKRLAEATDEKQQKVLHNLITEYQNRQFKPDPFDVNQAL